MRRRTLLATLGAGVGGLAGLAGCLDAAGDDPASGTDGPANDGSTPAGSPPGSPTDDSEPTGDATPTGTAGQQTPAATVTVESLTLQYGVVMPASPDSIWVEHTDTPYVLASVAVDGELAAEEFALAVGDERVAPTRIDRLYRTSWGDEQYYGGSGAGERSGPGLLLFDCSGVADGDGGDVRLTWPGGEQALGEAGRERLSRGMPSLSATLDLPETHSGDQAPPVRIEVTNDGDAPARFLGALDRVGPLIAYTPVARVSELLGAGESTTIEISDDWAGSADERGTPGDGEPDVTYHLYYAGGEDSGDIRLVESGDTGTDTSR